jgi:hypothetical protein
MPNLTDTAAAARRAMHAVEPAADRRSLAAGDIAEALVELALIAKSLGRVATLIKRAVNVTARGDNDAATPALVEFASSAEQHLKAFARQSDNAMLAAHNAGVDLAEFVKEANKSKETRKFVFKLPGA